MVRTSFSALGIEPLEPRDVPAAVPLLAFGADAGAESRLLVLNKDTGEVRLDRLAFGPEFRGGVRVAVGDVTGDGQDDVIAASGPGMTPVVRVFDGATGEPVRRFAAAAPAELPPVPGVLFSRRGPGLPTTNGVTVAAGDLTGDGRAEVVTGSGPGGPATVAVYDGRTGRRLGTISPADLGTAGVRVAAGDATGDGRADILVTPASGPGSTARLFAHLDIAEADAAIVCWRAKFKYNLWRPVTAIRSTTDPTWEPLLATPPFPSYTSGHSTFSGAAAAVLAAEFGADRAFATTSDDGTMTRSFAGFAQAADEAGMSRVNGGIHYPSDNTFGLRWGRDLGATVVEHLLRAR